MADSNFEIVSVGAVYAQALVNAAQQRNALAEVTEDMQGLKAIMAAEPKFALFCGAATISDDDKIAALSKIFAGKVHQLVIEVLKSMARRDRLIYLSGMVQAFDNLLAKLAGRVDVELVTAQALTAEGRERIRTAVATALGQEPDFKVKVDPSLIGGMRLRIEDTQIDGSVEAQLLRLQRDLEVNGASRLGQKIAAVVE